MKLLNVEKNDIDEVVKIGVESFIDDEFYGEYTKNKRKGYNTLLKIFNRSVTYCVEKGYCYKLVDNDTIVGFSMGFNYKNIKFGDPEGFNEFFHSNKSRKQSKKLVNILNGLEKEIEINGSYIYILALAVKKEFRNKGYASKLIDELQVKFRQYRLIVDADNDVMKHVLLKHNFEEKSVVEGCTIMVRKAALDKVSFNVEKINIAVPHESNFLDGYDKVSEEEISGVTYNGNGFFTKCNYNTKSKVDVYHVDKQAFLCMQALAGFAHFEEYECSKCENPFFYYTLDFEFNNEIKLKEYVESRDSQSEKFVMDVFTSIPVVIEDKKLLGKNLPKQENNYCDRLITQLNIRTEYETGIPVQHVDNRGFKDRLKRINLGTVRIQHVHEDSFNMAKEDFIDEPYDVCLLLSMDLKSKIGVLHVCNMSFKEPLTNYLDSVSRNQILIDKGNGEYESLYKYLLEKFSIVKEGNAKNFVSMYNSKEEVGKDYLASITLAETFYSSGEEFGYIVDSGMQEMLNLPHGVSFYNYADEFVGDSVICYTSTGTINTMKKRIVTDAVTIFFIELVLFEEAAISYSDDCIRSYLADIQKKNINSVLNSYNAMLDETATTAEFWNLKMNYPSSDHALKKIRGYFMLDKLLEKYHADVEIFEKVYSNKSDYVDKIESSILTAIGAILTTVSIIEIISSNGFTKLAIAAGIVGIFLILKTKLVKRKKDKK